MKVFIWKRIDKATDNYHTEGGLVVFAETEERAREISRGIDGLGLRDDENPDHVRGVDGGSELIFVMEDAGCC